MVGDYFKSGGFYPGDRGFLYPGIEDFLSPGFLAMGIFRGWGFLWDGVSHQKATSNLRLTNSDFLNRFSSFSRKIAFERR